MTAGQGLWIAILLTILVAFIILMLLMAFLVLRRIAKVVTETSEAVQNQVRTVTDRANSILDQVQQTVQSVTVKIGVAERAVSAVAGAVTSLRAVGTAKKVAANSAGMAARIAAGLTAGLDRLLNPSDKRKDESRNG